MQILIKIRTKGRDNYSNKKKMFMSQRAMLPIYNVQFTTHNNCSELSGI